MSKLPKIGITHGDINGIGYEVILKVLNEPHLMEFCTPIVYGSSKVAGYYKKNMGLESLMFTNIRSAAEAGKHLNLVNCCSDDLKVDMGKPSEEAGLAAYAALKTATSELQEGQIDAVVTAPINKATIQAAKDFNFPGHTEYFGQLDGHKPLMILLNDNVRVALVTNHLPVSKIAESITNQLIIDKLNILDYSLRRDFGILRPRIAVLALNPHAGDNGVCGTEETDIIRPAVAECSNKGICCVGPLPADGFFGSGNFSKYDAILAMYHDQGLAPFKALFMDEGVNFTAGLDLVRTSPAHGTAYDIVGKNCANETSMRHALFTAIDILRNRAAYDKMHANPLKTME